MLNWQLISGVILLNASTDDVKKRLLARGREDNDDSTIDTRIRVYKDNIQGIIKQASEYNTQIVNVFSTDAEQTYIDAAHFISHNEAK
jgi:deoxyadenosine/deoxycytidine kinase